LVAGPFFERPSTPLVWSVALPITAEGRSKKVELVGMTKKFSSAPNR
jgi:hypothetical protein